MKFKNIDFLKTQEGKIVDKDGNHVAYQDQGGVWTIGYGHTGDVNRGDIISEAEATSFFLRDIEWAENAVDRVLEGYSLTQNQFDALVSLTYNIGAAGFRNSTVVKRIKAGDYTGAADAILWWNKIGSKINKGLVNRRAREKNLFLKVDEPVLPFPDYTLRDAKIKALLDKLYKDLIEVI